MCLAKDSESPKKEVPSPRSPWAKLLNRQNSKPRLPRKVANSAKVNLNKCWNKLGELMSNSSPRTDLVPKTDDEPLLLPFSDYFYPIDPVKPLQENVSEVISGSGRFEIISDGVEISENVANEVREICYSATKTSCFVCKLCY